MLAPLQFYPSDPHFLTVVLDTSDVRQAAHLGALERAFGTRCCIRERLDQRFSCLHLLPGGAAMASAAQGSASHE